VGGEGVGHVALEGVSDAREGPAVIAEELLEGADGEASGQGDGLAGLAVEVREQSAAVGAQEVEGLGVVAAEQELLQVVSEVRPQLLDLLRCHDNLRVRSP
jgi:hypothetical protein